jgi:hypothetical protein
MRILIIDSHKGIPHEEATNLHVRNARVLSEYLGATLVASYEGADDIAQQQWDAIICNHASGYANVDYKCVEMNPDAKLFYITNEYNLGEPQILWMAAKQGRKYDVIANHPAEASKVVKKYVDNWNILNLNCLIFSEPKQEEQESLFAIEKNGVIYYGSFRKGRAKYFQKYFDSRLCVSTSQDNILKFSEIFPDATARFIGKIKWFPEQQLKSFQYSLYIEDEKTHTHYNHLANRFYEALSCDVVPIFDESCLGTIEKSGYNISKDYVCSTADELHGKNGLKCDPKWIVQAKKEKQEVLQKIKTIIEK